MTTTSLRLALYMPLLAGVRIERVAPTFQFPDCWCGAGSALFRVSYVDGWPRDACGVCLPDVLGDADDGATVETCLT